MGELQQQRAARSQEDRGLPVDLVRIDSIYNPVRRANFTVNETRVGQRTDYDRLVLTVETNGTISPEEAVSYAAALAQVKPGMTRAQVRYLLGTPQVPGAFDKDRWDYDYYLKISHTSKPRRAA